MVISIVIGCTSVLIVAVIHSELRSALYEIELSNGMEVLVSPQMYREIVHQYRIADEPQEWKRWDECVLEALRTERPREWKYLVESFGDQVKGRGSSGWHGRHTAKSGKIRGTIRHS